MMELTLPGIHDVILMFTGIVTVYLVASIRQLYLLKRPTRRMADAREPTLADLPTVRNETLNQAKALRANHLAMHSFALELKRMNIEVSELRAALRSTQNKNDSRPAPFYNEAMEYARRGLSAVGIAARCQISLGEAELVIALARSSSHGTSEDGKPATIPLITDSDDRRPRRAAV
jgi:hypothetical protein